MSELDRKHFFPFMIPVEPAQLGATGSGTETKTKAVIFDGFYTVLGIMATARGKSSPHPDFRIRVGLGSSRSYQCNGAFSMRAFTREGVGFWFQQETGDNLYVQNGNRIEIECTNDTANAETVSLQLICLRGWINNKQAVLDIEKPTDTPVKMNIQRTRDKIMPYVWVIEPSATITTGSSSGFVSMQFGIKATILRMNYGIRGTLEGVSMDDIRAEIELPGGLRQQPRSETFSLKALTKDNAGFDFIDVFGKPLKVDSEDRLAANFYNDTGADAWASLVLIGYEDWLPKTQEDELIKLLKLN